MPKKKLKIPFSKLSRSEKRVAIAKDVIEQLKIGVIGARKGVYLNLEIPYSSPISNLLQIGNKQLNKSMINGDVKCEVCAKGALLACHILKTNHITVSQAAKMDYEGDPDIYIRNRLAKIFSQNQLDLIEAAFETWVVADENRYLQSPYGAPTGIAKKAVEFGKNYENTTERLIAIMKNIIKNKGVFLS